MQDLPHHYAVTASGRPDENIMLSSDGLDDLETAGPAEFGGPGDLWSPETLLVGAVADCFILSFRATARAARLDWDFLRCDVVGTLDKVDRVTQFTRFDVRAELTVPAGTDEEKAHRMMEKADRYCLVTNSMKGESHLEAIVRVST
ncbi:MAG: OsmC family protein [Gammaproteobacteria bacterium]|nr:OsmC family protein [Gammaproteobacteria bacterium]